MRDDRFDAFSALLLELYRVSAEEPLESYQDAVLNLIKPLVPFDTCMWGTATYLPGQGMDIHTIHLHEQSQDMINEYAPLKHMDTCATEMSGLPFATRGFHCATRFADRSAREYREYLRRFGHENVFISAFTDVHTGATQWMSLFRADIDQQCRSEEVEMLDLLSPHLMQGLRHNRARHLERAHLNGEDVSEALIADARGVIHYATPGCEDMLRAEFGALTSRGHLPEPLLARMCEGSQDYVGRHLVASHRVRKDLLYVRLRLPGAVDRLPPRQREVAELMAQGLSHKETAQHLGRSPATVRNQMQDVYRKLGVRSVAALAQALRRSREL